MIRDGEITDAQSIAAWASAAAVRALSRLPTSLLRAYSVGSLRYQPPRTSTRAPVGNPMPVDLRVDAVTCRVRRRCRRYRRRRASPPLPARDLVAGLLAANAGVRPVDDAAVHRIARPDGTELVRSCQSIEPRAFRGRGHPAWSARTSGFQDDRRRRRGGTSVARPMRGNRLPTTGHRTAVQLDEIPDRHP